MKSGKIKYHRKTFKKVKVQIGCFLLQKIYNSDIKFKSVKLFILYIFKLMQIMINNKIYKKIDLLTFRKKSIKFIENTLE